MRYRLRCWRWAALALLFVALGGGPSRARAPVGPTGGETVALYVLAYDNRPTSWTNLTPHYTATIQSLITASLGHPDRVAVVLADLDAVGDTHIRLIRNGTVLTLTGLPDPAGVLDPARTEYDMADGPTLGGFLRWAALRFPNAARYTLTLAGHGAPLAPETDLTAVFGAAPLAPLPPLPTNIGANPDFTDHHTPPGSPRAYSILTPHALATALAAATAPGQMTIDVLDLMMCFAASVEELVEVAPFVQTIVASPNYAFFDPSSPGASFAAHQPALTPAQLAKALVQTYDALLPATAHPRILVALDAPQFDELAVAWDAAASRLYAALTDPASAVQTRQGLLAAFQAASKYDLTYCAPPDWSLVNPDGLVDLRSFAFALRAQFPSDAELGAELLAVIARIDALILERAARDDVPWFAPTVPTWVFGPAASDPDAAAGIALYADLQGQPAGPAIELSWHAHWYDDTPTLANPHPYRFTTLTAWDELFQAYWAGTTTQTAACMPTLPPARTLAGPNLRLAALTLPAALAIPLAQPAPLALRIHSAAPVNNPLLKVSILQNGTLAYSATLPAGPLQPGFTQLTLPAAWTPTSADPFTLTATIDADDRIAEPNEADNSLTWHGRVTDAPDRPRILARATGGRQLLSTRQVDLTIEPQPASPPPQWVWVQAYQFAPALGPWTPTLRGTWRLPFQQGAPLTLTLPASITPGRLVLHVWGATSAARSLAPAVVELNYAPAGAALAPSQTARFRLDAALGDSFALALSGATAQVWDFAGVPLGTLADGAPFALGPLQIPGPLIVEVRATAPTTYTLSASRNGAPLFAPAPAQGLAQTPPAFNEPYATSPDPHILLPWLGR